MKNYNVSQKKLSARIIYKFHTHTQNTKIVQNKDRIINNTRQRKTNNQATLEQRRSQQLRRRVRPVYLFSLEATIEMRLELVR